MNDYDTIKIFQYNLFEKPKEYKKRNPPVRTEIGHKLDYLTVTQKVEDWIMVYCSLCKSNSIVKVNWWWSKKNDKKRAKRGENNRHLHLVNCGCRHNSVKHGYTLDKGSKEYKLHECVQSAKQRAKKKNKKFDIDTEYMISIGGIPEKCPILGIKLKTTGSKVSDNSPNIDEIRHGEGYIKGNVRIVSFKFNRRKSDLTIEHCQQIISYIKGDI